MKRIFVIFLTLLFFTTLSSVSALENGTDFTNLEISFDDDSIQLLDVNVEDVLADSEITVHPGDSIQSAIDAAEEGSTIVVEKGTYTEDLTVSKGLSIKGQDAVVKSGKTAFNILSTANKTLISGFTISLIDENATGIMVNASDCKIIDNTITGGNIGILSEMQISNNSGQLNVSLINNIVILDNNIRNMVEAGISVYSFSPIVARNNISNIRNTRENGTATGLMVNGAGVIPDDLKVNVTDNHVRNVKSLNASAYGMDISANSIFDTLVEFYMQGNTVEDVTAPVEAYGMNIGSFSLNTTLPTIHVSHLNVSKVSGGDFENASVVGLGVSITTIGQNETSDTFIHDINVKDIEATGANAKAKGIDATGVGCADIYISNNKVEKIRSGALASGISASGIEYTNFMAFVSITNNTVTNLKSKKINGIYIVSLGNAEISHNYLYNLPSEEAIFITGLCLSFKFDNINMTIPENATIEEIIEILKHFGEYFNNTNLTVDGNFTAVGNNIEGTGIETGFAVVRESEIHYNRAVNLKVNVIKDCTRTFILESYGYDPNMTNEELAYLLLKSQETFENCTEEELRNMSASLGVFLDEFFEDFNNLTAGDVNAKYNWWGSNTRPAASKFKNNNGKVLYNPWLVMNVKSSPSVIKKGEYSKITVDVYTDSSGGNHRSKASSYFSGPRVTLSTDLGSFNGKKSITLNWTRGQASAYLKGDREGLANVTATDYDSASTTVLIIGDNGSDRDDKKPAENIKAKVMPVCGNPVMLVLVVLMSLGSSLIFKRK